VGTFLVFGHPVIILFDSRASHDFMSSTCAKRVKLALTVVKPSYMISTSGGRVVAKSIAREVLLKLAGQVFPTHLIVLDGQGIDVILGMSWMKLHKGILDIARRLVYLDSLIYGKVTLHLPVVVHLKASIHHTMEKNIEEIPVV
jgi:predicted aspartyl protease